MANMDRSTIEASFNRWKDTLLDTTPAARGSLILKILDRFGIKNADDLIYFLNSPEGKTLEADIALEIAALMAEKEAKAQAYQQEEIRQERFLGYLLIAEQEQEASHRSQLATESMIQLANLQKNKPEQPREERIKEYNTLLNSYSKAEAGLQSKLETQETALQSINDKIKELKSIKSTLQKVTSAVSNEWLEETEEKVGKLNKEPLSLEEKISRLRELQAAVQPHEDQEPQLDSFLEGMTSSDSMKSERISHWLAQKLKALQINDAFFTQNGLKKGYDEKGELLSSVSSAAYIVPSELQLARKNNKLYLIPVGESIDNLSQSELQNARDAFKSQGPGMRSANKYRNDLSELLNNASQGLLEAKAFKTKLFQDMKETKDDLSDVQKVEADLLKKIQILQDQPLESRKDAESNRIPTESISPLKTAPRPSGNRDRMDKITAPTEIMRFSKLEEIFSGLVQQREQGQLFMQNLLLKGMSVEPSSTLSSPFEIKPDFFKH